MIVVLSLNPAVDRTLLVPHLTLGSIHRPERAGAYAGGKGLNVARVLRRLGEPVRVVGFLGGPAAPLIHDRCRELGIEQRWTEIAGETRTCVIVVDPHSDHQTVLNEIGPHVTPLEVDAVREAIAAHARPGDVLCISGSAPPGVPSDFYARTAVDAGSRGVRVLADLTGEALASVAAVHPWALAPNYDEAEAALGAASGPVDMARRLAGVTENGLLTLGADGVIYASSREIFQVRPPAVRAVNAVGSGDAFVAGFLAGTSWGLSSAAAVRLGVACGASNAGRFEQGISSRDEIDALMAVAQAEQLTL